MPKPINSCISRLVKIKKEIIKLADKHSFFRYDAKSKAGQVTNYYYVKQEDEDALTAVLALKGPVAIAINAGQRDFQFYNSESQLALFFRGYTIYNMGDGGGYGERVDCANFQLIAE